VSHFDLFIIKDGAMSGVVHPGSKSSSIVKVIYLSENCNGILFCHEVSEDVE
jgi:hypothetical protein